MLTNNMTIYTVPLIWRYLISQYLKVLFLSTGSLLAVFLITRLDEIARFVSFGADLNIILRFAWYQILYLLPIVILISTVLASLILFQRLSRESEITALRSCGFTLKQIITPILFVGGILSLFNFYVVSELATESHLKTKQLQNKMQQVNPLILLQNGNFFKSHGIYTHIFGSNSGNEKVTNAIIAVQDPSQERIHLILSNQWIYSKEVLTGQDVTLISSKKNKNLWDFDTIVIDNVGTMTTSLHNFLHFFQKEGGGLKGDHLKMSLLLIRTKAALNALQSGQNENLCSIDLENLKNEINHCFTEFARRLSLSFAAIAFTFLGISFGMMTNRNSSIKGILYVIGLSALFLICFFFAKSQSHQFVTATLLYCCPLLLISFLSYRNLKCISQGKA